MITLYDYLPSQNAWKVRLLLNHLGQQYKQVFVSIFEGEGQLPDYLEINPSGAVPAIQEVGGQAIAESNAILQYLAFDTEYLPSSALELAQVSQWLFFESDYVQSSIATLRHWVLTGKDKNRSNDVLTGKRDASLKVLSILDRRLGGHEYLAGRDYTIADMSVFAYVHLSEDTGLSLNEFPNVKRWIKDVQDQPRFLHDVFPYSIDQYSCREL